MFVIVYKLIKWNSVSISTVLCLIKVNSNTIELTVHTLCYSIQTYSMLIHFRFAPNIKEIWKKFQNLPIMYLTSNRWSNLILSLKQIQWGSENRTCQDLEWSTLSGFRMVDPVRFSNGPFWNGPFWNGPDHLNFGPWSGFWMVRTIA